MGGSIFTELADSLVCTSGDLKMRYFKAGAITIGFMSHLILDEIWSVDLRHAKLKSSFGTALKFWAPCWWANGLAYTVMIGTTLLALKDPIWVQAGGEGQELHEMATSILKDFAVNTPLQPADARGAATRCQPRRPRTEPAGYAATDQQAYPATQQPPSVDRPASYRSAQPSYRKPANDNDGWDLATGRRGQSAT